MRMRGSVFWSWADPTLHHRAHEETLIDRTSINVQVRLSRKGRVQLFIGVYAPGGMPVYEEAFDDRPKESMTRALAWGVMKAREVASCNSLGVPKRDHGT
ncbi:hypothetical protein DT037_15170 [Pseudomonas fulva]|uniref:hypothetical protein n=1 Tax=Pseudomonas fulva TaxID=47880 RepID=UPI0015F72CD8|nr:hypothetical protein [Pseudomonas fulva]MBA5708391.1 hypothetical protein [Pseudomonas fulva]